MLFGRPFGKCSCENGTTNSITAGPKHEKGEGIRALWAVAAPTDFTDWVLEGRLA